MWSDDIPDSAGLTPRQRAFAAENRRLRGTRRLDLDDLDRLALALKMAQMQEGAPPGRIRFRVNEHLIEATLPPAENEQDQDDDRWGKWPILLAVGLAGVVVVSGLAGAWLAQ